LDGTLSLLLEDLNKQGALQGKASDLLQAPEVPENRTLSFPGKMAYSLLDDEFAIADSNHNQIITLNRKGEITRRIGSGSIGQKDGSFAETEFFRPQGLCYHEGVIWVADTENHLLRRIDLSNNQVETVAGTGVQGQIMQNSGPGRKVAISSPWDVSIQGDLLYFANAGSHQIGVYNTVSGITSLFAGTGAEAITDGTRILATFAQTSGLSIGEDKLFLADSETSAIRSIQLNDSGLVESLVGTGLFDFGDQDGKGKSAILQHPLGVHYSEGKVYIADSYNHKIRVLDLATEEVTTIRASAEIICDDASCTRLWEPAGVLKLDHNLYVTDTNNHRILQIDLNTEKTSVFIQ
jgi:DNA-binding beta-propeller fold protein YncE